MEEQKIKISVIDFLPEQGKYKIGHKDKDGNELHIGDTVSYNDQNWIIVYRYGHYLLKQIGQMAMIGPSDFSKVAKQNAVTAGPDWVIIGYSDESLFDDLKTGSVGK